VDTPVVTWTENLVAESAPWKSTSTVSQRFSIEGAGAALARDRESVRARRLEIENCILKIRWRGTEIFLVGEDREDRDYR
jgi:hypothetical protein